MVEQPKREVVTIDGVNVTLNLEESPVKNLGVTTGDELFQSSPGLQSREERPKEIYEGV